MASKYGHFWRVRVEELRKLIEAAIEGHPAEAHVSGIRSFGDRSSWGGKALVQGRRVFYAPMAHANALGQVVTEMGLCEVKPELVFRFTITASCRLRVALDHVTTTTRIIDPTPRPSSRELIQVPSAHDPALEGSSRACGEIHRLLSRLPVFESVEAVPFRDGLYFFYESGENSPHASMVDLFGLETIPEVKAV